MSQTINNDGGNINYKLDTFVDDVFCFNDFTYQGKLGLENYERDNINDLSYTATDVSTINPPIFLTSKNIVINNNLSLSTANIDIKNIFFNEGRTKINKSLYLEDKYSLLEENKKKNIEFIISKDLTLKSNLNLDSINSYFLFEKDVNVNNYKNVSLFTNNFIVEDKFTTKNITISNKLKTDSIHYGKNVSITDEIHVINNFNSAANLNINTLDISSALSAENLIVGHSIIIKNNALHLPQVSIYDDLEGSIRYNHTYKIIEAFIDNKWDILNVNRNRKQNSFIKHHTFKDTVKGTNIDFVQNNNITFTIDSNNKNIYFYNKFINNKNNIIKKNLAIKNTLNINKNSNISGTATANQLLNNPSNLLLIKSNINTTPEYGAIRYNDKTNIYESFIHKWRPLQQITNNNNTLSIDLYPKTNEDYNSILFNVSNSIILNINNDTTRFNIDNIQINENGIINKNLFMSNNLNTQTLTLNNHNITKKDSNLINDTIVNNIKNPITSDKLFIPDPMNINTLKYIFYTSLITTTDNTCNTINPLMSASDIINKYSIFINKYKIYNTFTLSNILINLSQKLSETITFTLKINNTHQQQFSINNNEYYKHIENLNIVINQNTDLSITISSNKNINNIYGKITLFGYYKDLSGVLLKNNSHISIDQPNIFHDTNRKFKGNVTITKDLTLKNHNNLNIPHLYIQKNVGIGTTYINNDFIVKNTTNDTLFIYKNNKIGIHTDNPTALFTINSNINSTSISTGSIIIDNNMNNTGDFTINQDLNGLQNATIKNTIHTNNILDNENLHVKDNIHFKKNVTSQYNINVNKNINISNMTIYPNLIFTENIKSNIIFNKNIDSLQFNINNKLENTIQYPSDGTKNKIYLEDKDKLYFKYNNKSLLTISNNSIVTNSDNINTNNIFSISSNFNITKDNININSKHFIVNNIDLLDKINTIERCYYSPYNINCDKITGSPNKFKISYNRPQLYGNLNNYNTLQTKNIEYIGFQFCLGNTNINTHPNWNINSFIYYKDINQINFNNTTISYNNTLNINTINKTDYINSTLKYDFKNTNHTYNLNISTDKTQLIYNSTNSCIFTSDLSNQDLSLRLFPIYNTRSTNLYYSTPINFKLN